MGKYYGVNNESKMMSVSDYWKGSYPDPSQIHIMAHHFGWSATDEIYTSSYADCYRIVIDNDKHAVVDYQDVTLNDNDEDVDHALTSTVGTNSSEIINLSDINFTVLSEAEFAKALSVKLVDEQPASPIRDRVKVAMPHTSEQEAAILSDHFPDFEIDQGGKHTCKVCKCSFDVKANITAARAGFSGTFFCN